MKLHGTSRSSLQLQRLAERHPSVASHDLETAPSERPRQQQTWMKSDDCPGHHISRRSVSSNAISQPHPPFPEESGRMVTIKLTLKVPPGKTAPRLIEDVLRYDPLHPAKSGRHVVIDPAPIVEDGQLPPPDVVQGACRHKFMTKPAQSVPPPTDARPDTSTSYVVASFCVDCRIHVRLDVDYADHYQTTRSTERPCPNQDFPLHHFQLIPSKSSPRPTQLPGAPGGETWTEHHSFECSSPTCSAAATVTIKSPRLTSRDLSLLVDEEAIALRVQPVLDAFPDRLAGYTVPKPIRILGTLKAYLADSMRDVERKKVNSTNKRFLTTLGEGCLDLLHRLGFEYVEAAAEVCVGASPFLLHSQDPQLTGLTGTAAILVTTRGQDQLRRRAISG